MDDPSVTRYRALLPHRRSVYLAFDGKVDFGQSVHDILVNNIVVGGSEYFQRNCLLSEALGGCKSLVQKYGITVSCLWSPLRGLCVI